MVPLPYHHLSLSITVGNTAMKTLLTPLARVLSLAFAAVLVCGCHDMSTSPDQTVGSGRIVTRQQQFEPFSGICLTGIGSIYITQSASQTFLLEADDNVIDRVTTTVDNNVLTIGLQPGSYSGVTINAFVSMKSVELLELIGTGKFTLIDPFQMNTLACRIQGAGSMTLRGSADEQLVEIQGVGDVHSFDLEAAHCTVVLSGTGSAEVKATQRLDATVSGVGSIVYDGNPHELSQHVSGVGTIHPRP
jgi:hypothetical protein